MQTSGIIIRSTKPKIYQNKFGIRFWHALNFMSHASCQNLKECNIDTETIRYVLRIFFNFRFLLLSLFDKQSK